MINGYNDHDLTTHDHDRPGHRPVHVKVRVMYLCGNAHACACMLAPGNKVPYGAGELRPRPMHTLSCRDTVTVTRMSMLPVASPRAHDWNKQAGTGESR